MMYIDPNCPHCRRLKDVFLRQHVPFKEVIFARSVQRDRDPTAFERGVNRVGRASAKGLPASAH